MAKVTKKTARYSLELTEKEAQALTAICGKNASYNANKWGVALSKVFHAMNDAGVEYSDAYSTINMTTGVIRFE